MSLAPTPIYASPFAGSNFAGIRSGESSGVIGAVCAAGPVPAELMAATVKPYELPLTRLDTVAAVGVGLPVTVTVGPPALARTLYPVMAAEPTSVGAIQVTSAVPFPAVAPTPVGTAGGVGTAGLTLVMTTLE